MGDGEKKDKPPGKIIKVEIKIDKELAGGQYANICLVNHTDSEFVVDSFFLQPAQPRAIMKGRLILSPRNAKRLMLTLRDQIKHYEQHIGEIDVGRIGPPVSVIH